MNKILSISILFIMTFKINYAQLSFGKNGTFSNKWYEGKLILNNNDTLIGVVKFESAVKNLVGLGNFKPNKILFKKSKKSKKKKKYKKNEVINFIIRRNDNKIVKYEYIDISKNKRELLLVLAEGNVNLYEKDFTYMENINKTPGNFGTTQIQKNGRFLYLKKKNEKYAYNIQYSKIFKSFKVKGSKYFSKCKSVINKINDGSYKWYDLEIIVLEYNECKI